MKWNTKRKAVVALLALAGVAFCVDRFVLGYGPRSARAATPIEATIGILAPTPAPDGPASAGKALLRTCSLAERVAKLGPGSDDDSPSPDGFALPASWLTLVRAPEMASDKSSALTSSAGSDSSSFTLSSVVAGPNAHTPAARINGRLIQVGQKISGHELLRVEHQPGKPFFAVLRGSDPESEIRVPLLIGGDNAPPPGPDAPDHPKSEP